MNNPLLRYQISYTKEDKTPITIPRSSLVNTAGDIVFIGKNRLEYGEVFNTNMLHLLENFAAHENPEKPGTPHYINILTPILTKPSVGQVWYNKTQRKPFVWSGRQWVSVQDNDVVAGNSGVVAHGQQLPRPISADGYVYAYDECAWVVSPFGFNDIDRFEFMSCYTDSQARVNMQYKLPKSLVLRNGVANYQIIGIRNARSLGVPFPTPNVPGLTPTPTATPEVSLSPVPLHSPTPTPTRTRTPGQTRSATPTPSITRTETPVPSLTRTHTPTPTPTPTITATVTPSAPLPKYVDIHDQDITGASPITYSVLSTGIIVVSTGTSLGVPNQWLYNDDPAYYSVRVTRQSGTTPTGTLNSWLNCAVDRSWALSSGSTTLKITIKRNVDDFVMAECIVTLTIE